MQKEHSSINYGTCPKRQAFKTFQGTTDDESRMLRQAINAILALFKKQGQDKSSVCKRIGVFRINQQNQSKIAGHGRHYIG
jgi:hypothetical protein